MRSGPLPEAQLDRFLMKLHIGYPIDAPPAARETMTCYMGLLIIPLLLVAWSPTTADETPAKEALQGQGKWVYRTCLPSSATVVHSASRGCTWPVMC
jgi:hypothetical protein